MNMLKRSDLFLTIVNLLIINNFSHSNAECCLTSIDLGSDYDLNSLSDGTYCGYLSNVLQVHNNGSFTINRPHRFVCPDGSETRSVILKDCGVGKCNIFGCNCDSGCKTTPSVPPACSSLLSLKHNISSAIIDYHRAIECAKYRNSLEKTPCLGARFGSPCINPGYCDKPESCSQATSKYDKAVVTCAALGTVAIGVAIYSAGITLPVNFILGGTCTTVIAELLYIKNKFCSGSSLQFN